MTSASDQIAEIESSTPIVTNVWYHVAGVRGSNFTQIYVNGQLERQTNVSFPQDYGNLPLYFGSSGQTFWDHKLRGTLDEVSLYNRALTSNEIAAIYTAGASGKCKAVTITVPPTNQTVVVGANAGFGVSANGIAPLGYQWQFNGASIVGATNTSLTLTNIQTSNGGNYAVVVTNKLSVATSSVATLTVLLPPSITAQPQSSPNITGTTAVLSGSASGSAPLSYQWQLNGLALSNGGRITGANLNALAISAVQLSDAGNYALVVSNPAGSVTSAVAVLSVLVPASITTPPAGSTVIQGSDATFNVIAAGTQPLSYQWRFNGADIVGATASSYTRSAAQPGDAGSYFVIVTNVAGSVTSAVATLTVNVPPSIPGQPHDLAVNKGQDAAFSVAATGTLPLGYQWRFNFANISGATGSNYTRTNCQPGDAGGYAVVVTNVAGSVTSLTATLTVYVPPSISGQPQSLTVTQGQSASFSVTAGGTQPLSYQWRLNSTNLPGATASNYSRASAQIADAGNYTVVITNMGGALTSGVATLTVLAPPSISSQPQSLTVTQGLNATFTVTAAGTLPLGYQWSLNGTNIPGATGSALALTNVQLTNAGSYRALATNAAGAVTSSVASLIVLSPPVLATQPSSTTNVTGGTVIFSSSAVGTTPLSYRWRFNGTNLAGTCPCSDLWI